MEKRNKCERMTGSLSSSYVHSSFVKKNVKDANIIFIFLVKN